MNSDPSLLRPFNYPKGNAGFGYGVYPVQGTDLKIGVLNLQGRTFMPQIDDPFAASDRALKKIREETHIIFVRSEEHTSELQSRGHLVCRLLLEKKKNKHQHML